MPKERGLPRITATRTCGAVAMAGAILPIPADVISWLLAEGYNPIRQSISALAVGPSSWLIDLGLWSFVLACLAMAFGFWSIDRGDRFLRRGGFALAFLAADVGLIALLNEYAGRGNAAANLHAWAVYALGVLFAVAVLLPVSGLRHRAPGLATFSLGIGIAWIVLCPLYLLSPESWNGAFERFLALAMLAWLYAAGRNLMRRL